MASCKEKAALLGSMVVAHGLGFVGAVGVYYALDAVDGLKPEKDNEHGDSLELLLKYTIAPLGFLLWATFEFQAIQRVPSGGQPWSTAAQLLAQDKVSMIISRIAQNSFEQTFVTLMCALGLISFGDGKVGDFEATRFAIAHVYMYILGRIGFSAGYILSKDDEKMPGIQRVYGLLIGGFWLNAAYFFMGLLIIFGVANTAALLYIIVILLGVVVPSIIFVILPSAAGEKPEEKAKLTAPEPEVP